MTTYVRFGSEIHVGGEFTAISAWDRAKHGNVIQLEEKGAWVMLTIAQGVKIRVPMHNVQYIRETAEEKKP